MEIHSVQVSILHTLRHVRSARYTDLRLPTELESDAFKFHLQRLITQGSVHKLDSGHYELTTAGKELANNISKQQPRLQKQPKLSVAIIAPRNQSGKATEYLFQERLRNPYYGFWGSITGPVQWGESIETTAQREFEKQTSMTAERYSITGFYRKTDYDSQTATLLEDKLFAVVEANDIVGALTDAWQKGHNAWLTLAELQQKDKYFTSTGDLIEMTKGRTTYAVEAAQYTVDEY